MVAAPPGKDQDEVCYVDVRGSLGSKSVSDKLGICPALLLDIGVSRADFLYERAVRAAELEAAGQYAKAADLYEALGAYNDSVMRAKQCRYRQALLHQEAQEYEEALKLTNKAVMEALDGLPPVKVHCSLLAEEAIHAALWDYAEKHGITIDGLEKPVTDIGEVEE